MKIIKILKRHLKELRCEIFGHKFINYFNAGLWNTAYCKRCGMTYALNYTPKISDAKLKKLICNWGKSQGLR